ncbi:MAG: hypothetical protein ACLTW9_04845 [Enterocloster sp.]
MDHISVMDHGSANAATNCDCREMFFPTATPLHCSPHAKHLASFSIETGRPPKRPDSISRKGMP